MAQGKKNSAGSGTIRKKNICRGDKTYTYWEARITTGFDPGTGSQIQRSFSGKTQREVRQKMQEAAVQVNSGTYQEPSKLTLAQWLHLWSDTYLMGCKPRTADIYKEAIRLHIAPALGAVKLEALNTHTIQRFYNDLIQGDEEHSPLSPKTVKDIHGILHSALRQAVANGYLRFNPSDNCSLPRRIKPRIEPLNEDQLPLFLSAIKNQRFEDLFFTALFTGAREGEIIGLTWDCVDFEAGCIRIDKQLQLHQEKGAAAYEFAPTKSSRERTIEVSADVLLHLKHHRSTQAEQRLFAGEAWQNDKNLVFTDELGHYLTKSTVYRAFKKVVTSIGRPDARFHDLRHTFAFLSLRLGVDIKTLQELLGHASAAFTLDTYGHATKKMRRENADRIQSYLQKVSAT